MKEKELHRRIEEQDPEIKRAIYEQLREDLIAAHKEGVAAMEKSQPQPQPRVRRRWLFAVVPACICVVLLAVMLPLLLKDKDNDSGVRYLYKNEYTTEVVSYTVHDYAVEHNLSLLYLDWYAVAEPVETKVHINLHDTTDLVFLEEKIINGETGDVVILYVTEKMTRTEILEMFWTFCTYEKEVKNISVKWGGDSLKSRAMFEYNGYRYYLELADPLTEDSIFEIIEEMLP